MIAGIDHVTRNTKEMPNCTVGKSNLAVFEQILLRNCFEHGQLLKDKTKVSVRDIFVQKRPRNKLLTDWPDPRRSTVKVF